MADIPRNRREWGVLEASLEEATPLPVRVAMDPAEAQVRQALHLSFSITPVEQSFGEGTAVLSMVPKTWKLDLNGAFPEISKFFAVWKGGYGNGRECLVKAETDVPGTTITCELISVGFEFLVYARISGGEVPAGQSLRIHLAHPDGPRVRAPQTVQFHPFVTAVALPGEMFGPMSVTPGVQTYGGATGSLRLTTQAVIEPGEVSTFKVVPMDVFGLNRGFDYAGEVDLAEIGADAPSTGVTIGIDQPSVRVRLPLAGKGHIRYARAMDLSRNLVGRSNPVGRPEDFGGYRVYFGDLHVHCRPCDGYGTMQEAYDYAYDISELDFASVSHQQNSGNFPFRSGHWQDYLEINERFCGKEAFATLPICENYSTFGHRHSLFGSLADAEDFPVGYEHWGEPYAPENHPERLWEELSGREALTFPHHMKFIHGTDFSIPPSPMEPVMEICSRWGISECGGEHSAQYALSQGRRMGFIAGTDNHLGQPGSGTHGYNEGRGWTAVFARELTREAIYEAIKTRRCYATTGAKILMYFEMSGNMMGEEVQGCSGDRSFQIRVAGTRPIRTIEVIRNGIVVHTVRPGADVYEETWCDQEPIDPLIQEPAFDNLEPFCYYYLRVIQVDMNQAWSSPIWLTP